MEKQNNKRELWLDFVKILATFLVVVLHTVNYGLNINDRNSGLFIYYCGTIAIPLFFMANGYVQLNRQVSYQYIFKKVRKIIFLVLIWNIFPFLINLIVKKSMSNIVILAWESILQKGYFFQFWFLGSLLIIDLILPILSRLLNSNSKRIYVFCAILIIFSVDMDIYNIKNNIAGNPIIKDTVIQTFRLWTWITYFCLGGLLHRVEKYFLKVPQKIHLMIMIISFLTSIIYEYFFSLILYGNLYAENFYDNPPIIFTTVIVFTYFKRIDFSKWKRGITVVGPLTMGIYIIHPTIIKMINHLFTISNNFINIVILMITVFTSGVISFILYKIPKMRNLIKL